MKLLRFGAPEQEQPGIQVGDRRLDVSSFGEDYDESFFERGGIQRLRDFVASSKDSLPEIPTGVRLGPPFCRPSKIICVGLNYADHAKETMATPPSEPILFFKSTTALCGPDDIIILPRDSVKTDWEVELAVVIGQKVSYVDEAHAPAAIAGYCVHNDLSERAFQLERNGQWVKGKSCDTFAPMGPFLATTDEVPDPGHLRLWLTLNGKRVQDSNTSNLIFKVPFLVSYISQFMTLLPGDVISTGTPPGVGLGMNPQVYLKDGDIMELGIDGLGTCHQRVKGYGTV
ncbi:MAG: fumarylacetoacetate hydrolase family protein [Bacteroidota bacterium]|nr:fumarylacetoacetate hydrolase family protein [Bacteroidota bacterium]